MSELMKKKITVTKILKHFKLVLTHKYFVFLASIDAGIPLRGLFHDTSKFFPIEFFNSVKYYTGDRSPIDNEKDEKGYSLAWLHHRGRNKHHWEYWIDNLSSGGEALRIPYKYVVEMLCDWVGAGKAYEKKKWTRKQPFAFFIRRHNLGQIKLHLDTYSFCFVVLQDYANTNLSLRAIINKYKETYKSLDIK